MNIQLTNKKLNRIKADCEVVFVIRGKLKHKWVRDGVLFKETGYKGERDEIVWLPHRKRMYVGVESQSHDELRVGAALAVRALVNSKCGSIKIGLYAGDELPEISARTLTEGFVLGAYDFTKYRTKPDKQPVKKVFISTEEYSDRSVKTEDVRAAIVRGVTVAESVNFTREIVNRIPAEITPVSLAEIARKTARENGLGVKVHGEAYLKKESMGAFLAVSQASPYPPQLIHLTYKKENPQAKIVLVGKGLTYDTGGLSLKPSENMRTMKMDKSGAAAILGIMQAVSRLDLPFEVHGIIGAVENAIGKHAYKPDDVLTAKNGKTIEVKNTDAEGRLVLADCLAYAQEENPDYLIDLATLTGACVIALGQYTMGVMGHNDDLKNDILRAARDSGELATTLDFNRYLSKLLKSEVADISNVAGTKYGGALTAGLFLSEFIDKRYRDKWIHLDIAGPAFVEKAWGYHPYGATGAGVRLVIEWMRQLVK